MYLCMMLIKKDVFWYNYLMRYHKQSLVIETHLDEAMVHTIDQMNVL